MRRIGVVVNPVAGMGGRLGLKGTDGKVDAAAASGADPRAPERARAALRELRDTEPDVHILTYGGIMGEREVREEGFEPTVVGQPDATAAQHPHGREWIGTTTAGDTRDAVRTLVAADVDLILFAGGDGTAVDVAETLEELESEVPILGVPAGVKVYSGVFGVTPAAAGRVAGTFERTEREEVTDIDEDDYRAGEVNPTLRAVVEVPVAEERQASKQLGHGRIAGLAAGVAADIRDAPDVVHVLGPGSTVSTIEAELGVDATPLGVDVYRDDELVVRDASEREVLDSLGERNRIVVSPIGGQGFVLGRGNQQISPAVVRKSELVIVASRRKLDQVGVLRVDSGDPTLDAELRGWHRVRVGRHERRLVELV